MFASLPRHIQYSMLLGGVLGLLLTAFLFMNVQWYHDLLVWSWTNPWIIVPSALLGLFLGWFEDQQSDD